MCMFTCCLYMTNFLNVFADAGLTGLTHLDLFGARITDSGTNYLRSMLCKLYQLLALSRI